LIWFNILLVTIYLYLNLRLSYVWFAWIMLTIMMVAILSFPYKKVFRYQIHLSFAAMGFLTYLTLFTLFRDIIWLTSGYLPPVSVVLGLTLLTNIYGYFNATTGPRIKRVDIPVKGLPEDLNGFSIAQISDLHAGPTIRRPYVEKVVEKINGLKPDIIVLTGDIGDGHADEYRDDVAPLKKMKSRYGSFYVPGNHEYYWNANEWLTIMNNMGIINVVNRGKVVSHSSCKVLVGGIPDPVSKIPPDLLGIQDFSRSENVDFKILLSHRPGIAKEASRNGFDLQLSGHTHAGQFFPWTIVVRIVHKMYEGLYKVGDMWLYVNTGTGSWGPLLRLGTSTELTLLTLTQGKEFLTNEKK
jgi:uncharacterized protein